MNAKEQEQFRLTFSLVEKQQKLLANVLPVVQDIVTTLRKGSPSHEQLDAWQEHYRAFDQRLHELTRAFAELVQAVDSSLIHYDA